ncbi:MAG: Hsp70 family protein, partial [Anaerolineales bacterium]|nr:Hsp70 family protein [Anaerolineales bacterium]
EDDKVNKEQIESRNNADTMAYTADKTLRDLGDKVPEDIKTEVESKVAEVRAELEKDPLDTARLQELTDSLSSSLQKVGEAAYQSAAEAGEEMPEADSGKGTEEGSDEDDVVEGEFEDV